MSQNQLTPEKKQMFLDFLNKSEAKGRTALYMAVENNRPKALLTLLQYGASPNIAAKDVSPLALALEKSYIDCAMTLITSDKILINKNPECLKTALKIKSTEDRNKVVCAILKAGFIIEWDYLETLINDIKDDKEGLNSAVEEALNDRARKLSNLLKDCAPLTVQNVNEDAKSPFDIVTRLTGFTINPRPETETC